MGWLNQMSEIIFIIHPCQLSESMMVIIVGYFLTIRISILYKHKKDNDKLLVKTSFGLG